MTEPTEEWHKLEKARLAAEELIPKARAANHRKALKRAQLIAMACKIRQDEIING